MLQSQCSDLRDRRTQHWSRSSGLLPTTPKTVRHGSTTTEEAGSSIDIPGRTLCNGMLGNPASVPCSMGHHRQPDLVLQSHSTLERDRMQLGYILRLPALDGWLIPESVQI